MNSFLKKNGTKRKKKISYLSSIIVLQKYRCDKCKENNIRRLAGIFVGSDGLM